MEHLNQHFLLLLLTVSYTSSQQRAHSLSSYGQLTTSSSLGWVEVGEVGEERLVRTGETGVCRLRRGGRLEAGSLSDGECRLVEGERLDREYEVLVDLYGMGRVEWRHWDMFTGVSIGTVSYLKERYVASLTLNSSTVVGDMSLARGLSGDIRAWVTNQTVTTTSGEVLVELEPVRYQLERLSLGSVRVVRREEVRAVPTTRVLGQGTGQVTVEVSVRWNSSRHWGHVEGLVRGRPTVVEGEHLVWGVTTYSCNTHTDTLNLSHHSLNLSSSLTLATITRPYTALLTAIYRDGLTSRHNISAEVKETLLERVSHFTADKQLVGSIRVSPPSTTSTSTATTTLKQSKPKIDRLRKKIFKKSLQSANLIEAIISSGPQRYKENPLKIFYPDDDLVEISGLDQQKNFSVKCSSSHLDLSIFLLLMSYISL